LRGPSWPWSYGSWIYIHLCNQCLSLLMLFVRIPIGARCTTLCDKAYQWLATGRWFSLGPPVSFTNKTDRHDITAILLTVALSTIKQTNITNRGDELRNKYQCDNLNIKDVDSSLNAPTPIFYFVIRYRKLNQNILSCEWQVFDL
jgi:hypothetical protein